MAAETTSAAAIAVDGNALVETELGQRQVATAVVAQSDKQTAKSFISAKTVPTIQLWNLSENVRREDVRQS